MDINSQKIDIIGLGYVGLPLAVEFGKSRTVLGFDINDALDSVVTDSWDDAVPTGTQGPNDRFTAFPGTPNEKKLDGFDGLRNFNQVRPGVFDGGYAFSGLAPGNGSVSETSKTNITGPRGWRITIGRADSATHRRYSCSQRLGGATNVAPGI